MKSEVNSDLFINRHLGLSDIDEQKMLSKLGFNNIYNSLTFPEAWALISAFALQLYFDFSGYSEMAVGLGLMFGYFFQHFFGLRLFFELSSESGGPNPHRKKNIWIISFQQATQIKKIKLMILF